MCGAKVGRRSKFQPDDSGAVCQGFPHNFCLPAPDCRFLDGPISLSANGKVAPRPAEFSAAEYGIGDFYRTFAIASEIDSEKIAADYRDGVLTVHLPKQEK